MTKQHTKESLEKGIGTIYHELGHLLGYILSNQIQFAGLGEPSEISIGISVRKVSPAIYYYHFDDPN